MYTVTRGMNNVFRRRERRQCKNCGLSIPRYPGRYPNNCPSCGASFAAMDAASTGIGESHDKENEPFDELDKKSKIGRLFDWAMQRITQEEGLDTLVGYDFNQEKGIIDLFFSEEADEDVLEEIAQKLKRTGVVVSVVPSNEDEAKWTIHMLVLDSESDVASEFVTVTGDMTVDGAKKKEDTAMETQEESTAMLTCKQCSSSRPIDEFQFDMGKVSGNLNEEAILKCPVCNTVVGLTAYLKEPTEPPAEQVDTSVPEPNSPEPTPPPSSAAPANAAAGEGAGPPSPANNNTGPAENAFQDVANLLECSHCNWLRFAGTHDKCPRCMNEGTIPSERPLSECVEQIDALVEHGVDSDTAIAYVFGSVLKESEAAFTNTKWEGDLASFNSKLEQLHTELGLGCDIGDLIKHLQDGKAMKADGDEITLDLPKASHALISLIKHDGTGGDEYEIPIEKRHPPADMNNVGLGGAIEPEFGDGFMDNHAPEPMPAPANDHMDVADHVEKALQVFFG